MWLPALMKRTDHVRKRIGVRPELLETQESSRRAQKPVCRGAGGLPEQYAKQSLEIVEKLLDAFIVHGDLSEYNLLLYRDRIFVIDFPQAVDLSSRPNRHRRFEKAKPLLRRDLENVARYFSQYDIEIDAPAEYDLLTTRFEKTHLD